MVLSSAKHGQYKMTGLKTMASLGQFFLFSLLYIVSPQKAAQKHINPWGYCLDMTQSLIFFLSFLSFSFFFGCSGVYVEMLIELLWARQSWRRKKNWRKKAQILKDLSVKQHNMDCFMYTLCPVQQDCPKLQVTWLCIKR